MTPSTASLTMEMAADDGLTGALFVSDDEIARRWGVCDKTARGAIREFERARPGRLQFPPKDPLFANKRFWPAVRAFMMARYGISMPGSPPRAPDGKEDFDAEFATRRRRAGSALAPAPTRMGGHMDRPR